MRPPSVGQEECTRKGEEKELILKDAGEKDFKMIALRCWRAICGLSLTCHRHVCAQLQLNLLAGTGQAL